MLQHGMGSIITITADMNKEIQETVTFVARVQNLQTDDKGLMIGAEFLKETHQTDIHCLEKLKRYMDAVQESINFE
jgi:hypothetical protein